MATALVVRYFQPRSQLALPLNDELLFIIVVRGESLGTRLRYFMPKIYDFVTDRHCSSTTSVGLTREHD